MPLETDVGGLGPACRIDDRKRTLAVTHEHAAVLRIHPHVVGIVAELDTPDRRKIVAPQHPHRAVAGVRHIDAVREGDIGDALRLAQAGDPAQHLAGCQIDHPQGVVAELGNKQPLPLHIDAEVVDAAAHLTERDLRIEYERRAGRLRRHGGGPHQACRQQDRPRKHAQLLATLMCASAAFSPSASFLASSLAQKCMK